MTTKIKEMKNMEETIKFYQENTILLNDCFFEYIDKAIVENNLYWSSIFADAALSYDASIQSNKKIIQFFQERLQVLQQSKEG